MASLLFYFHPQLWISVFPPNSTSPLSTTYQRYWRMSFSNSSTYGAEDQDISGDNGEGNGFPRLKAPNINRGRFDGHLRLMRDYFDENSTYGPILFRRRFRMSKTLVLRIIEDLQLFSTYF